MEFNEIMAADIAALNEEQQGFIVLHRSIMAHGNAAYASAVQMARGLKEMRDSGKYKAAGFATFGEYAESACGIKERQAYNYISVVENLSQEFLQSTAKIGVSKLAILASMTANDRADLLNDAGEKLGSLSTKELEQLKKQYESRIQQMKFDFSKEIVAKEKKIEELSDAIDEIGAVDYQSDIQRVEDEKAELLLEIERLKTTSPKTDEKAAAELAKAKEEVKKLKEAKAAAEKKAKEEKEKAEKEIAAITEKERAAAKAIEKDLELERARLEVEAKKAKIAADPLLSEFKVKYKLWREMENSLRFLIGGMDGEAFKICMKAMITAADDLNTTIESIQNSGSVKEEAKK